VNIFSYKRATSINEALVSIHSGRDGKFIGGGTNLVDLMKMGVERPAALTDITRLPFSTIEEHGGGVRIGAMAKNSAVATHTVIRERYPVLSAALLAGASPQIRNMATVGGNLLQRTRCSYFYDPTYSECNKRTPGSGCAALTGYSRTHGILGVSDKCIATHPSDMAVAMAALDAVVQVRGNDGERSIPIGEFYRLPGDSPHIETVLKPGELITYVDLPAPVAPHSYYLKVRDRNSYAFALVSVAAVIALDDRNRIKDARIALGGVALKPWREPEAERVLLGKVANEEAFRESAGVLLRSAKTTRHNAFKAELARRCVIRALSVASERG
jgi:xanthine dehydrogenase YagS FAD-binding subunit